jgi:hypothetical protein
VNIANVQHTSDLVFWCARWNASELWDPYERANINFDTRKGTCTADRVGSFSILAVAPAVALTTAAPVQTVSPLGNQTTLPPFFRTGDANALNGLSIALGSIGAAILIVLIIGLSMRLVQSRKQLEELRKHQKKLSQLKTGDPAALLSVPLFEEDVAYGKPSKQNPLGGNSLVGMDTPTTTGQGIRRLKIDDELHIVLSTPPPVARAGEPNSSQGLAEGRSNYDPTPWL